MIEQKRTCSQTDECKVLKCPHHGEHTETKFCDTNCETIPKAVCIKDISTV